MNPEFTLPRRRDRIRPYLNLVAMIDTMVILLIFFAVASTLVGKPHSGMHLRLPQARTAAPVKDRVVLALRPGQPVRMNGSPVALEQIGAHLNELTGNNKDAQIVVMPDEKVTYSDLVGVLDQVRLAEYPRIALAAAPKTQLASYKE